MDFTITPEHQLSRDLVPILQTLMNAGLQFSFTARGGKKLMDNPAGEHIQLVVEQVILLPKGSPHYGIGYDPEDYIKRHEYEFNSPSTAYIAERIDLAIRAYKNGEDPTAILSSILIDIGE